MQSGDTVLVQNHSKGPFDPKYVGDYHVVSLKGNQVKVQPSIGGLTEMKHIKHVKYILPADRYIKQIPNYSAFGRKAALRMNPDKIPQPTVATGKYLPYYKYWTTWISNFRYIYPWYRC